jgi:hypothetical protein
MPTARKLLAGLALAMMAVSCSDDKSPTAPAAPDNQAPSAPTAPKPQSKALLTNRAASGALFNVDASGNPTTPTGATLDGFVTVTHMAVSPQGQLLVSGTFTYTNAGASVVQTFTDVPATLKRGIGGGPTQPTCTILDLDIGAIHLDLLGLVVDLAPIHLDITAVSGSGNLLGNLLCALAGLLNGPNLGGLLGAIQDLLDQINAILAGL